MYQSLQAGYFFVEMNAKVVNVKKRKNVNVEKTAKNNKK
jgi:hypothetical protein